MLCFVYLEKQTPISALIGAHELSVMFRAKGERLKISLKLKGGGGAEHLLTSMGS